jgi:hypothetical protein
MRVWLPALILLPLALTACPALLSDWKIGGSGAADASTDTSSGSSNSSGGAPSGSGGSSGSSGSSSAGLSGSSGGLSSGGGSHSGGSSPSSGGALGASGAEGGQQAHGCATNLPGPRMVEVPTPQGGIYCIDSTEVTNRRYVAFLTARGSDLGGQDSWCAWNTTFVPSTGVWPPADDGPVAYANWCDAFAYCKWAGKHLCGKIGGGPNAPTDFANPTASEWYNACSAGGTRVYPYGASYEPTACNTVENGVGKPLPVGSKLTCEGGYPGLFDMSGNLWEWEDSCNGQIDKNDSCQIRGGPFDNGGDYARCAGGPPGYTALRYDPRDFGFRCCATAQ